MEEISVRDVTIYQRSARLREERRRHALVERWQRAQRVAHAAARVLIERFGASRVVLFGSVAHGQGFHAESDIDLAVEGITMADFWRAWAALDAIDPAFELNLIAIDEATPALRVVIDTEGVDL